MMTKFFAPAAVLALFGNGATANEDRELQTVSAVVLPDSYIDFNGDGCYDFSPNAYDWSSLPFSDDYTVDNVSLGFNFTFDDGTTFETVNINSKGHIYFSANASDSFSGDFEGSSDYVIAPFWADMNIGDDGYIKYKSIGGNQFAVVWQEVSASEEGSSAANAFQVVLSSDESGKPQICLCYNVMEWSRPGGSGISSGPGSGFLFASFTQGGMAWNGIGSSSNGLGHLDGHSYCFDTSIVSSTDPASDIISTNDETIPPPISPASDPTSSPTVGPIGAVLPDPSVTSLTRSEANTSPGTGGDPHITTWANEHFEYHGQCDLVLLKDAEFADGLGLEVHIRTKIVRYWSYIKNVAIKIGNDILEVEGSVDAEDTEAHYWINYEYQGELEDVAGFPVTQKLPSVYKRSYTIDLSSKYPGQSIVVELYKEFVRVRFNGDEQSFGKSVGLMGDYKSGKTLARDGNTVMDDFTEFGDEWQVVPSEPKLFHVVSRHPQFPELCIKPEDPRGERKRRLAESNISIEQAEAVCAKSLSDSLSIKDCVYDVLATQDLDMVGAF